MIEYPIMFTDLRGKTQMELLAFMGVEHYKDLNWDVIPVFVVPKPELESEMPVDDDRRAEGLQWCKKHGWFYRYCDECKIITTR